jgi:hypothetical protein
MVLTPVRATFRAVAETVVPEVTALDADGWRDLHDVVETALAARPDAVRRQLVAFLRLIEYLPIARHLRRFSRLSPPARTEVLMRLERSRPLTFRRGLWGLRTLVMLGYYTRADVQEALGYRAHREGWSARRVAAGARC